MRLDRRVVDAAIKFIERQFPGQWFFWVAAIVAVPIWLFTTAPQWFLCVAAIVALGWASQRDRDKAISRAVRAAQGHLQAEIDSLKTTLNRKDDA
jgi:hypothetical protein